MKNKKIALFSGRFDPPHGGHLISIMRLGKQYKKVIVVILDHKDQKYPVCYRQHFLKDGLSMANGSYEVLVNNIHFGEITLKQIRKFKFDEYVAGNHDVLLHIESLGVPATYLERSYDFAASDIRKLKKLEQALK